MTGSHPATKSPANIHSLVRGLAVIRVFNAENSHLTVSDVARRADLTRATARRILHTFVDLGYVATDGKNFSLRPKILELGYAYLSSMSLPAVAQPHLERLTETAHESSSVAVLDGSDIAYVARVAKQRIMTVVISVGTKLPAYATSMGRVILAYLPPAQLDAYFDSVELQQFTSYTIRSREELVIELKRIREQGWALVDQELEEGLRSIAAPIHDHDNQVIAAINLSASSRRSSAADVVEHLLPHLLATSNAIDVDLRNVNLHPA